MVWPDRPLKKSLPSLTWPAGRCLVGGGAQRSSQLTAEDLDHIQVARLEAVRVGACESFENVAALRQIRPGMLVVASLTADLSDGLVSSAEFVRGVSDDLRRLSEAGVNYFEVAEQPNLQSGGWGRSWRTGLEFGTWFQDVLAGLKDAAPQARFGFPGLAPGGEVVGWRGDAVRFLADAQGAVNEADWIGVDCYGGPPATGWEKGLSQTIAAYRASFPDKLLFVAVEAPPEVVGSGMARAQAILALFRRLRSEPNVGAAFCVDLANDLDYEAGGDRQADVPQMGIAEALGQRGF